MWLGYDLIYTTWYDKNWLAMAHSWQIKVMASVMSQPKEVQIQALAVSRTIAATFFRRAKSPIMEGELCCISLRKLFEKSTQCRSVEACKEPYYYDTAVEHATSSTARSTSDCFSTIRFSPYFYYVIAIYSKCVSD